MRRSSISNKIQGLNKNTNVKRNSENWTPFNEYRILNTRKIRDEYSEFKRNLLEALRKGEKYCMGSCPDVLSPNDFKMIQLICM